MNQASSSKRLTLPFVRGGLLVLIFSSGLYTTFISQASSPDYRRLFWSIVPVAVVHFALAIIYFIRVRDLTRWAALGVTIVALAFLAEMSLRVWL